MGELDDLVDDMANLLNAPCTLEDTGFRLIGFSGQRDVDTVRRRSILERSSVPEVQDWFNAQGIRESPGPLRTPADPDRGISGRLCVPARHLSRVHGYFWLLDPADDIPESIWPEAMRIAEVAALLLSETGRRQARRDVLYRRLVEGRRESVKHSAGELAGLGGIRADDAIACVLVESAGMSEHVATRALRPGVLWANEAHGIVAAVLPAGILDDLAPDAHEVLTALGRSGRLISSDETTAIGVGPVVGAMEDLYESRSGALVALRVARAGEHGNVVRWGDLGPLALLGVARDVDIDNAVFTPQIRQFVRDGAPELLASARAYLNEAGSMARTAKLLSVHRQTLYHRLSRVEHLTGCSFSDGNDRLRLHLALRLAPYLGADPGGIRGLGNEAFTQR